MTEQELARLRRRYEFAMSNADVGLRLQAEDDCFKAVPRLLDEVERLKKAMRKAIQYVNPDDILTPLEKALGCYKKH